jgi:hypothetical protein
MNRALQIFNSLLGMDGSDFTVQLSQNAPIELRVWLTGFSKAVPKRIR